MRYCFYLLIVTFLAGCTAAGPFVTGISSDGKNGLLVDKCSVHMNAATGAISNKSCVQSKIILKSEDSKSKKG